MIRLLRRNGVIVGAEESFPSKVRGELPEWHVTPIVDFDEKSPLDVNVAELAKRSGIGGDDGMRLKFINGVLHQSIQMTPGGQWTDYNPVPSESTPQPVKKSLAEELYDAYPAHHAHMDVFRHLADRAKEVLLGEDREHGLIDLLNATMKIPMAKRAQAILNFLRGEK